MSLSIRKNITRSRNGCAECKSKRIKCDEAKPSCSRCERLGIPCPGYKKPLKWSTRSKPFTPQANTLEISESGNPPEMSGYAIDQPQCHDQSTIDLQNSEFSEQFADIINTGGIRLQEHDSLESPLSFIEPLGAAQQFDMDPTPGPSSYIEYQEPNEDDLWQDNFMSTAQQLDIEPTPRPSPQIGHQDLNKDQQWPDTFLSPLQQDSGIQERRVSLRPSSGTRYEIPLSKSLQDHSSILVEYYFKEVCGLMSCYDSRMNPYRTVISNVWSQSQSLYYIIQSMAAACLSEVSPNLAKVSRQLRDAAVSSVSKETKRTQMETPSLLALVMLGMSLSWHDAGSLGQSEFELLAKAACFFEAHDDSLSLADKQKKVFFYNSLIYWRMLLSFVTDQELTSPAILHRPQPSQSIIAQPWELRMPHPQTGIGIEVQELVAKVGSLIRRERKRIRSRRYSSREDIEQSEKAIQTAENLYVKLCAIDLPKEDSIVDSGDEMTPTAHLLKIAEAYRCMGLLQLYRNFPDLLSLYSSPRDSASQSGSPNSPDGTYDSTDTGHLLDTWLTCLALHILDLVEDVAVSSRSRSIQPLLLVGICSELSLSRSFCPIGGRQRVPVASITSSPRIKVPPTAMDVLQARRAVISRLSYFENVLAAKPIRRMLLLIKETWAWMDEKQEDVYWMDVMIEKSYETLMG
ncbi:C6 zinc finger domain protein [Ilyonectria robusta]|uniref:C6 zinc finger domain protein n=1 Tax=Ilyonectria robusta TaxID=1079257 RepID=UPI001E8D56DD|nr:C6 zinc finger domain protein [Ilyonectria robusta]KAH8722213.1 C6 zinc finger domain protein [Ilyonectria robusta]